MRKIILINPPFNIPKENYDSSVSVGLLSIATYLDSLNIDVKLIDGARERDYEEKLEKLIPDYDFVGISVMTTQIAYALRSSRRIKELNPNCKIIWGGSHPTFFVRETIEHPLVDIVSYGEGEITLAEILGGKNLKEVSGIAYKEKGEIIVNPPRPLHDPASMPLFNWNLVSNEVLENLYLIPSLTSRGCPHQCTFCINAILKNRWRPRSAEQVLEDLKIILNKECFKGKKLRFWDENFFVDMNRANKIIDGMLEQNLIIPWETTVRANYLANGMVNDQFLDKLKKAGCYLLSFGAESGSPRILKKIKKGITPDEIVKSAEMCLRHGIIPQYSFMIGLPGEERGDMMMTLHLIDRLLKLGEGVQILGPQAFRPYPGSELYEECLRAGWRAPQTLEEWARLAENELSYLTVKNFPWVKDKDFVESMEAYVRFGAHSIKSALGSSIKAQKFLKLGFILLCKLRWKLKFFYFPVEFKIAKRFVTQKNIMNTKKSNEEIEKLVLEKGSFGHEENKRVYEQSFKNWYSEHEYIYARFGVSLEAKMLEIGSAYGQNLIHFSKESAGIEVNPGLIDFSRSLGLNIIPLNAEEDLSIITEKYDIIWCTDFLVHMTSPYKFIYDCRNLLKEKGRIVIQIPLMSIFGTHRSSCHFYAFNKKSLLYLLEMAGYKVIKTSGLIRKKPRWFNYVFEPLLQIWGGNIWVLAEKENETPVNFKKVFLPRWFKVK